MKRGRPKHFITGQHIYAVHVNNRVTFHIAESEEQATKQAKGGEVVGKISPKEFMSKEKEYQEYFKKRYED